MTPISRGRSALACAAVPPAPAARARVRGIGCVDAAIDAAFVTCSMRSPLDHPIDVVELFDAGCTHPGTPGLH